MEAEDNSISSVLDASGTALYIFISKIGAVVIIPVIGCYFASLQYPDISKEIAGAGCALLMAYIVASVIFAIAVIPGTLVFKLISCLKTAQNSQTRYLFIALVSYIAATLYMSQYIDFVKLF